MAAGKQSFAEDYKLRSCLQKVAAVPLSWVNMNCGLYVPNLSPDWILMAER